MNDVLVLCYHAVSESWQADLSVRPGQLDEQLDTLVRRGYRGVGFTEAVLHPPQGRCLAVTFDDAYASVHTLARPILARHGLVASVFVATDFPASAAPMSWPGIDRWLGTPDEQELKPMSWTQLADLQAAGWEIGSHTCSHPRLTRLDDRLLHGELDASREVCTERLSTRCTSIAYPYGDVDRRVAEAARTVGYLAGAGLPGRWHRPRELEHPRVGVYFNDHLARFRLKVSPGIRAVRVHTDARMGRFGR